MNKGVNMIKRRNGAFTFALIVGFVLNIGFGQSSGYLAQKLMIENDLVLKLKESVKNESAMVVQLCASLEAQIAEFTELEEKEMFLGEYNLTESGLDKLIKSAYELLNLITYFTVGVQEVRAWTITKGWKAPKAASVIHTDFEKGFIKAEVMKYNAFKELKSEQACKEAGKLAIEGKEYVVEDGDIMHFRFNV